MTLYKVDYDEIVHRIARVEADSPEEAREIVENGETDDDYEVDSGIRIDSIEEVKRR